MTSIRLPYLTVTNQAAIHLDTMATASRYVAGRFHEIMAASPTNARELYEALSRVLEESDARKLLLPMAGEHMVLDQIHRWILRDTSSDPLGCGRLTIGSARHRHTLPKIGLVTAYAPDTEQHAVRFSLIDPNALTLIPETINAWKWTGTADPPREGGLPRGIATHHPGYSPTLRGRDDLYWGCLDELPDPMLDLLLRPDNATLMQEFHNTDLWRVGITAEWIRLARKWCPKLRESGEFNAIIFPSSETPRVDTRFVSEETLQHPDRLIPLSLVLLTRMASVNSVAVHLERSPDYVFLTGLLMTCFLHTEPARTWLLMDYPPEHRFGMMVSIGEFFHDHLRPKFPFDMDIFQISRPFLQEATVEWDHYVDPTHWQGKLLDQLLGDLPKEFI